MTVTNRLIHEKSPYLYQHARQPVDWYPWGSEALELAKKMDRPVLLSIGYSTCHWCHVMAHESFDDPAVARRMNEAFVCIKLDREERPDLDKLYITAVSALTGSAGWPLNVFLTPELKPFFGGTYFPPTCRFGAPAWSDLVTRITRLWQDPEQRRRLRQSADSLAAAIAEHLSWQAMPNLPQDANLAIEARQALARRYDREQGGFGPAPKFPSPAQLAFLMADAEDRTARPGNDPEGLDMALDTLSHMVRGGIYDQVGGGFHRYSVDARWHVPHFEKMLYDNAQLAAMLLDAYRVCGDGDLARAAGETLDYMINGLQSPAGGFFTAEDADSPIPGDPEAGSQEGAFYVWTLAEVNRLLGMDEGALWAHRHGMRSEGNVADDPHGMFGAQNVLCIANGLDETARNFGLTLAETRRRLDEGRKRLMDARIQRPRPHRDEKIIVETNGLAIGALARAAEVLHDGKQGYLEAAVDAATFIEKSLYDPIANRLQRRWCQGEAGIDAMAADYAFLAQGLADLFETTGDPRWKTWAERLAEALLDRFRDSNGGGLFMTSVDAVDVPVTRIKEDVDSVIPSAASVAALVWIRLARWTGRADFKTAAVETVDAVLGHLARSPEAVPMMLVAKALLDREDGSNHCQIAPAVVG